MLHHGVWPGGGRKQNIAGLDAGDAIVALCLLLLSFLVYSVCVCVLCVLCVCVCVRARAVCVRVCACVSAGASCNARLVPGSAAVNVQQTRQLRQLFGTGPS